jgi:NAD(P)H-hydrate epimerase
VTHSLPSLPPRPADGHKGTFGTVCIIGGQCASSIDAPRTMIGGPALAALSALRIGTGRAVLAMPAPILKSALTIAPSATGLALPVDGHNTMQPSAVAALLDEQRITSSCLALGPGLGTGEAARQIVLRLIGQDDRPLIIDADALNCLAATTDVHQDLRAPSILTPHPGEFERLANRLDLSANPLRPDARPDAAAQLARRLGCIVVLKGHRTIISDGIITAVNETGNVALATAGTGDVLTGALAGLVAQFHDGGDGLSLFDCARLGVHLHGIAADLWAAEHGDRGLLAAELADLLPAAIRTIQKQ